jgi:hypothetical protein
MDATADAEDELAILIECPLLAQSGHPTVVCRCPLSGVKRTLDEGASMSAFDPKQTWNFSNSGWVHLLNLFSREGRHG